MSKQLIQAIGNRLAAARAAERIIKNDEVEHVIHIINEARKEVASELARFAEFDVGVGVTYGFATGPRWAGGERRSFGPPARLSEAVESILENLGCLTVTHPSDATSIWGDSRATVTKIRELVDTLIFDPGWPGLPEYLWSPRYDQMRKHIS